MSSTSTPPKTATLYRMVMDHHVCPYGIKSKWLLEREGYFVDDHHLTTRAQTDAFMEKHNVSTTPQTFIGDERVGGFDALRVRFWDATPAGKNKTTYQPVIAIFTVAALMAIALAWRAPSLSIVTIIEQFAAIAMSLLALQKLQNVESFSTMFLNYDLLAKRFVPYGYFYPFAEAFAGVSMLAGGAFALLGAPVALFIGGIGAASVFKAVYIEKRALKCACVGGSSNVPLGFVSLTENLTMIAMGLWMFAKHLI